MSRSRRKTNLVLDGQKKQHKHMTNRSFFKKYSNKVQRAYDRNCLKSECEDYFPLKKYESLSPYDICDYAFDGPTLKEIREDIKNIRKSGVETASEYKKLLKNKYGGKLCWNFPEQVRNEELFDWLKRFPKCSDEEICQKFYKYSLRK